MSDLSTLPPTARPRPVKAPTGATLHCQNWLAEAAYRMIQNNLDPAVACRGDRSLMAAFLAGVGVAAIYLSRQAWSSTMDRSMD
ncbi:MAG TPA: hypothetical protein VJM48_05240, partial [Methylibium sp.]|nr:hypothetical protein [Methylibium sp.]